MAEELEVGMKCIKYMLFVSNFMFVMIGFLLISIGSTIKAIYGDFEFFMESHYFSPADLAIAIGIIIFFVAIFGCVGAIKESTCLINMFGLLLSLILILEIAAAIAAYAMRGDIEDSIEDKMKSSIKEYYNSSRIQDIWDFTQSRLHCCGVKDASDWDKISFSIDTLIFKEEQDNGTDNNTLWEGPASCCRHYDSSEEETQCERKRIYKDSCLDSLSYVVSECALLLGCGALAVAFIQILGIVFAHMLAGAVRRVKTQRIVEREQTRQQLYEQLARGQDDKPTPVLYTSPTPQSEA